MEECHKLAIGILKNLPIDITHFQNNNEMGIKQELKSLIKQIDLILKQKYTNMNQIQIDKISTQVSEFMSILDLYLFNTLCKKRGQLFSGILQEYLCQNNAKNLDLIYHLITNLGIIMSGCIYIYIDNPQYKNKLVDFIKLEEFLQNLTNPSYRFSKSKIKECIQTNYTQIGLHSLILARLLLVQAINLRKSIKKYCPKMMEKVSKDDVKKHLYFEERLNDIVIILNNVIMHQK